jgi:ABC-2 type transport system permease protein
MTEPTASITPQVSRWQRIWENLTHNPVAVKELTARMRGWRAPVIISIYLFLMSLLIGLIYLGFSSSASQIGSSNINQTVGKTVFGVVFAIELMMVCFLSPAFTAGAISSERERQTYDLLRTTLLPARSLVNGKLISALIFIFLLLIIGFPVQSLAFLFGGVTIEEVLISFLILVITALTYSVIGLFISSFMKNTLASTVVSYVAANLLLFFQPSLITVVISFFGILTSSSLGPLAAWQQSILEGALIVTGYFLIATNPIATAIASEVMFLDQRSLFLYQFPLTSGSTFPILGPWIFYSIFFLLLSLLLVWLSILFVKRAER